VFDSQHSVGGHLLNNYGAGMSGKQSVKVFLGCLESLCSLSTWGFAVHINELLQMLQIMLEALAFTASWEVFPFAFFNFS